MRKQRSRHGHPLRGPQEIPASWSTHPKFMAIRTAPHPRRWRRGPGGLPPHWDTGWSPTPAPWLGTFPRQPSFLSVRVTGKPRVLGALATQGLGVSGCGCICPVTPARSPVSVWKDLITGVAPLHSDVASLGCANKEPRLQSAAPENNFHITNPP